MKKIICLLTTVIFLFLFSCSSQPYDFGPLNHDTYKTKNFTFKGKEFHYLDPESPEVGMFAGYGVDKIVGTAKLWYIIVFPYYTEVYADNADDPSVLYIGDVMCGGYYVSDDFRFPDWSSMKYYKYETTNGSYLQENLIIESFTPKSEFLFNEFFDCDDPLSWEEVEEIGYICRGTIYLYSRESDIWSVKLRVFQTEEGSWYFLADMPEKDVCLKVNPQFADVVGWYENVWDDQKQNTQ